MSIKVRGLEGLQAQLNAIGAELGAKSLTAGARAAFKRVADTAKALAPKDSGALADAIAVRARRPSKGDTVVKVGLVVLSRSPKMKQAAIAAAAFGEAQSKELPPSRRWHFAELGTSHSAPEPFMRPALDSNAQAVVDDLGKQVNKKIEAAAKKKRGGR